MGKKRGWLLLLLGILGILVGLGGTALGVIGVLNTSHHVSVHEGALARLKGEEEELKRQPYHPKTEARLEDIRRGQAAMKSGLYYYLDYRDLAYKYLGGGVVVLLVGVACLVGHFSRRSPAEARHQGGELD